MHGASSPVQSWQIAIAHPQHTRAAQHAGHKPPCLCPRAGPPAAEGLLDPALACRLLSEGLVPLQDQSFEHFGRTPAAKQTGAECRYLQLLCSLFDESLFKMPSQHVCPLQLLSSQFDLALFNATCQYVSPIWQCSCCLLSNPDTSCET